jgi:predicted nucleic acid-binding protein
MRLALDTNILAYAAGVNDDARRDEALRIIRQLPEADTCVSVQVLGEFFRVLVRKARRSPAQARTTVLRTYDTFRIIETSPTILLAAIDLVIGHSMNIWDAVILAGSVEAGCSLLLSEDLQDGFTWNGVTVVNPFAAPKNPLLAALLKSE